MAIDSILRVERLDIERILVPHYGLLDKAETQFYLKRAKESAVATADEIVGMLRIGKTKAEIIEYFKDKFYHGYVREIYPIDAMELNTGITVDLLERELT